MRFGSARSDTAPVSRTLKSRCRRRAGWLVGVDRVARVVASGVAKSIKSSGLLAGLAINSLSSVSGTCPKPAVGSLEPTFCSS